MTARILVVDDILPNIKLLEIKLKSEYYDVLTAQDGYQAIEAARTELPDLILLDVMMPGIDGFETCRQLKDDPEVAHIPVVMVTALNQPSDRVKGLEAGADDFITKPINDTALFARVKSLVRIKTLIDELRLRDRTEVQMGFTDNTYQGQLDVSGSSITVIDDDIVQGKQVCEALAPLYKAELIDDPVEDDGRIFAGEPDLLIVSTQLVDADGLRLCSRLKSHENTRAVPILMVIEEDDERSLIKGLEIGVNDYIVSPLDMNELQARVRTQLRRKQYQDALRSNYRKSISMAITDNLTRLYNRYYLDTHLGNMISQAHHGRRPFSVMIMDVDHFKLVNDTYGHQSGDEVLEQMAQIILQSTRSTDLAARFGGEEFVVVMPETDIHMAETVAQRIRAKVEQTPFRLTHEVGQLNKTISIGLAQLGGPEDTGADILRRADEALYTAKQNGRNQVRLAA